MKAKKETMPKWAAKRFHRKATVVKRDERAYSDHVLLRASRNMRVWKKVLRPDKRPYDINCYTVIELVIPKGALFWAHSDESKCRAERAVCRGEGRANYDYSFLYRVGKVVKPRHGFCMGCDICAGGIHFFTSIHTARRYQWS